MLSIILSFLVLNTGSTVSGDFRAIKAAYEQDKPLAYHMRYEYYDSGDYKKAKDTLGMNVLLWNGRFRILSGNMVYYRNSYYVVTVDKSNKTITVDSAAMLPSQFLPVEIMDSLLATDALKAEVLQDDGVNKTYRIRQRDSMVEYTDFSFSLSTGWLNFYSMQFREDVRLLDQLGNNELLRIVFSGHRILADNDSTLNDDTYYIKEKNTLRPGSGYNGYRLINNLIKQTQ